MTHFWQTYSQEEPLYPSAGVISRRAPLVESEGPVFELNLNVTDSEFIIVADASQADCSTVILRSTTVIAFRLVYMYSYRYTVYGWTRGLSTVSQHT